MAAQIAKEMVFLKIKRELIVNYFHYKNEYILILIQLKILRNAKYSRQELKPQESKNNFSNRKIELQSAIRKDVSIEKINQGGGKNIGRLNFPY